MYSLQASQDEAQVSAVANTENVNSASAPASDAQATPICEAAPSQIATAGTTSKVGSKRKLTSVGGDGMEDK